MSEYLAGVVRFQWGVGVNTRILLEVITCLGISFVLGVTTLCSTLEWLKQI